ncbi:hypothetical protein EYD10_02803 [Varanus komodoensis]|nr:hypothetical protein EYD10_02803 [Varanus komodoensis]
MGGERGEMFAICFPCYLVSVSIFHASHLLYTIYFLTIGKIANFLGLSFPSRVPPQQRAKLLSFSILPATTGRNTHKIAASEEVNTSKGHIWKEYSTCESRKAEENSPGFPDLILSDVTQALFVCRAQLGNILRSFAAAAESELFLLTILSERNRVSERMKERELPIPTSPSKHMEETESDVSRDFLKLKRSVACDPHRGAGGERGGKRDPCVSRAFLSFLEHKIPFLSSDTEPWGDTHHCGEQSSSCISLEPAAAEGDDFSNPAAR